MEFRRFADASSFLAGVQPWLERSELENGLMLGIGVRLAASAEEPLPCPYFAAVVHDSAPVLAALMTPPHRLIVSGPADVVPEAGALLIDDLREGWLPVPGVIGVKETASAFAAVWTSATNENAQITRDERLYALSATEPVSAPPGGMRTATPEEAPLLARWMRALHAESMPDNPPGDPEVSAQRGTEEQRYVVWDHDGPVAMAASTRPTKSNIGVNAVYTPPEHRNRGYATALVAGLCDRLLKAGYKRCSLYADLANPASNHVYRKIGFRTVCDVAEITFSEGP
ncbi:MAG: GNAT family N-acetyltransferase [Candidatus Bipolaricaulota bacterium]|nr:MAG: GNAT family N-acetyltransferase [Candidatus Bipolaricaulota bacterium]